MELQEYDNIWSGKERKWDKVDRLERRDDRYTSLFMQNKINILEMSRVHCESQFNSFFALFCLKSQ